MSARKFSDEEAIVAICDTSLQTVHAVLRRLGVSNVSGTNHALIKRIVAEHSLDTRHWLGRSISRLKFGEIRVDLSKKLKNGVRLNSHELKLQLIRSGRKEKRCEKCLNSEWMEKPIPLELHHLNGDKLDNRIENLQILCANCHGQEPNNSGRNRKSYREKLLCQKP